MWRRRERRAVVEREEAWEREFMGHPWAPPAWKPFNRTQMVYWESQLPWSSGLPLLSMSQRKVRHSIPRCCQIGFCVEFFRTMLFSSYLGSDKESSHPHLPGWLYPHG